MLYESILALHLLGAGLTAAVGAYTIAILVRANRTRYAFLFRALAFLAAVEVFTGVCLTVVSADVRASAMCANIIVYLAAVGTLQVLLYTRLRTSTSTVPMMRVYSPVLGSVLLLCGAFVLGY